MRKNMVGKIWFAMILLVLFIIVVFGKDIMAAFTKAMVEQFGSMMDQLLR